MAMDMATTAEIKELIAIPHFKIYSNNISIWENFIVYMTTQNDIIIHDNIKNKTLTICWHNDPTFIKNNERDIGIICITKNYILIGHESRLYLIPVNIFNGDAEEFTGFIDILPNFELIESIQPFDDSDNMIISTIPGNELYIYNITNRTFRNVNTTKRLVDQLEEMSTVNAISNIIIVYGNDQETTRTHILQLTSTGDIIYKDLTHKSGYLLNINIKANLVAYVDESSSTVLYTVPFDHYLKLDADTIEWCSEQVPFLTPQEFIIDLKITDTIIIVMTYKNIYYRVIHDAVEWCLFTVIGNDGITQPPRFKLINYENPQEPEVFDDKIPVIWSQLLLSSSKQTFICAVSIDGYVFKLYPGEDDAFMLSNGMLGIAKFRSIIDSYIFGEKYKIELIKEELGEHHDSFESH
jgi:hypothetical protein